ncbi:unnamed protein product, partial [Ectocarpus sp. 12 AP-2014]
MCKTACITPTSSVGRPGLKGGRFHALAGTLIRPEQSRPSAPVTSLSSSPLCREHIPTHQTKTPWSSLTLTLSQPHAEINKFANHFRSNTKFGHETVDFGSRVLLRARSFQLSQPQAEINTARIQASPNQRQTQLANRFRSNTQLGRTALAL